MELCWRHILKTLKRYTDAPRLLDVGAGNGYFVFLARAEFGFAGRRAEILDAEAEFARKIFGVELLRGELAALNTQYDVVSSFNVIEHVRAPTELLAQMRDRMTAGGYLLLTTPNPSCIHRRILGLEKWDMVCPPHHINLFTRRALLESTGARWLRHSRIQHFEHMHTCRSKVRHRGIYCFARRPFSC